MSPVPIILGVTLALACLLWVYETVTGPGKRRRAIDEIPRCAGCNEVMAASRQECPSCGRPRD